MRIWVRKDANNVPRGVHLNPLQCKPTLLQLGANAMLGHLLVPKSQFRAQEVSYKLSHSRSSSS